jgi:hypothetical protein
VTTRKEHVGYWSGLTPQDVAQDQEDNPYYCAVCDIDCQNPGAYDMHLGGKKHEKRVGFKYFELNFSFCEDMNILSLPGVDGGQLDARHGARARV